MHVRLLVFSDVRIHREGIAAALANRDDLQILGVSGSCAEALRQVASQSPDVLVIDMAARGSLDLVHALGQHTPATKIVAYGVEESGPEIITYAEAGVAGYVWREASIEDLIGAVLSVCRDEVICSPRIAATLFRRLASLAKRPDASVGAALTIREREVLTLIRNGLANKEIGAELRIAEATVKNHVHNILEKLQVKRRALAARLDPVDPSSCAQYVPARSTNRQKSQRTTRR